MLFNYDDKYKCCNLSISYTYNTIVLIIYQYLIIIKYFILLIMTLFMIIYYKSLPF